MKLAYLVHDLNDAAVARRVRMLKAGGAEVALAGFWRGEAPPASVEGVSATALARTQDGQLAKRALAVLRHAARPADVAGVVRGADVVIARNLEMLALAARTRPPGARLVYESLDIHRSLLGVGRPSGMLRALERRLMAGVDLLLTSSPAFLAHYFAARQGWRGPHLLVENKVLALDGPSSPSTALAAGPLAGPPWRIGWFGMLRCERSLKLLKRLAAGSGGAVEVVLRGRPARTAFADFDAAVADAPGLRFEGPYRADDLAALYGQTHFTWAIDWFEAGLNSAWLLPNRLYEGGLNGAVPLALADVETGAWLARHEAGLRLGDPERELAALFSELTPQRYADLRAQVAAIPRADLVADRDDCEALVRALGGRAA